MAPWECKKQAEYSSQRYDMESINPIAAELKVGVSEAWTKKCRWFLESGNGLQLKVKHFTAMAHGCTIHQSFPNETVQLISS